jgi:Spy/CpxP family protein refolding chaperone
MTACFLAKNRSTFKAVAAYHSATNDTPHRRQRDRRYPMKVRTMFTTAVMVALVAVPGTVLAQVGPGGPGGGFHRDLGDFGGPGFHGGFGGGPDLYRLEHRLPRMAEHLGLTEDQVAQIEAIIDEEMAVIEPLREQLHDMVQAHLDDHDPGRFDESELRSFLEEVSPLKIDIEVAGARAHSRVFNVLTPEQREQMKEFRGLGGRRGGGAHLGSGPTGS